MNYRNENHRNNIFSTLKSTKAITTKELPKNELSFKNEKEYFCYKDNMDNFIKKVYPAFFEEFELNNFINSGSVGYVYEGRYKNGYNNQKYAFKIYIDNKKDEKKDKKKEKNKFQEISIVKKLNHKNVSQILAFIKMDENSYFSVLELGKYGDLNNFVNNLLKRRILSETCINYFAKQILDCLEYIHRCKVIHMDIKQDNILVDSDLTIKIIDFSSSCPYSEFNPEDLVKFPFVGTGKYIAPEIIKRIHMKIKYAQKVDIYSFGVTLYYLTFGIYPYQLNDIRSKEYDKILEKVKSVNLEFPKEIKISEKYKDFLSKTLEKDYLKRISIKEALEHPWIKGWNIIDDEKQNTSCLENFLIKLISDNIFLFSEYIKEKKQIKC